MIVAWEEHGTWIIWCETCRYLSETLRNSREVIDEVRGNPHDGHLSALVGAKGTMTAHQLAELLPGWAQSIYWGRVAEYWPSGL